MNVSGVSVCYFTSLDSVGVGVTVCSFTSFNLAERGVFVCYFIFPDLSERGVNEYSLSRLLVQAYLSVHEF